MAIRHIKRLITLAGSMAYYIFLRSHYCTSSTVGRPLSGKLVVLMYHSVKECDMDRFRRQMEYLLKVGTPVFADSKEHDNMKNRIAVTFDDGFQNVVDYVLPITKSLGIPVTIFVPTGYLGQKAWWINDVRHENFQEPVLREEQFKEMEVESVKFGSHSVTHRRLTGCNSKDLKIEVNESKSKLEDMLGVAVRMFSLPYGDYDNRVVSSIKNAGYDRVFLNIPLSRSADGEDFLVGRVDISPRDWPIEYRLKINGAYQWLAYGIEFKRSIRRLVHV